MSDIHTEIFQKLQAKKQQLADLPNKHIDAIKNVHNFCSDLHENFVYITYFKELKIKELKSPKNDATKIKILNNILTKLYSEKEEYNATLNSIKESINTISKIKKRVYTKIV